MNLIKKIYVLAFLLTVSLNTFGQCKDFSRAVLVASENIPDPVRSTAIRTLQEEISQRTNIQLKISKKYEKLPLIILAAKNDDELCGLKVPHRTGENLPESKSEGFRIVCDNRQGNNILWLIGADARGVIFAIGEFLRTASLSKNKILFDIKNEIATAPRYPLRGHQLGYRDTANSWDAWTVDQFEKYIRELALFGTNSIENIPFQDGKPSPLMKIPRSEMNEAMSRICHNYGLDYWVWMPATIDLSDKVKFEPEVKTHAEFYKDCPYLDDVFFPGGDPGDNHPKDVMPFLKRIAAELRKFHPNAGLWISLQGFNDEQVDYFYKYLEQNKPDWLTGVVTGPGSPGLAETRYRLPAKYKHRWYPDITHTVRCDYPVLNWDQAFALTEGREVSNPQPYYYAKIFRRYAGFTDGFLSYSDGVHDDVNKKIWSQLGWNPDKDVNQILREYANFFLGNTIAEQVVSGVLSLEKNWDGPIEENGGIETNFVYWQNLERQHPELKNNWRWQLLLLRNYYDTYTARRKKYETTLENEANQILKTASGIGAERAMGAALQKLNEADDKQIYPELKRKIFSYSEALFQSIGLQTSVEKYHASGRERGAILDFVDYPLNNRWWLQDEFEKIRNMKTEKEKLDRLHVISTWDNPGDGSYYDDVSNVSLQPHVTTRSYDATDIAWWDQGMSRRRLSSQTFQNFPRLEYEDLDPSGDYFVRISGEGDALLRINGERVAPLEYNKGLEEFKLFPVARRLLTSGKIALTFDEPEESHLNWRRRSKVSDVWLLKNPIPELQHISN